MLKMCNNRFLGKNNVRNVLNCVFRGENIENDINNDV